MPLGNKVSQLVGMQIGDYIPCRYTAKTSGQFGFFSELGTCVATEISPTASSATPDGLFNLIFVGYDTKGRMKLIADRNIQHTISWDKLNLEGIASGEGLPYKKYNVDSLPTKMTSNTSLGTIIASATTQSSLAYRVFDGATTEWLSLTNNQNSSIILDYGVGNEKAINKYSIIGFTGNGGGTAQKCLKQWYFYGSDDGTNWTQLDFRTGYTTWTSGEEKTFFIQNEKPYRYYKLGDGLNNGDTTSYQVCISELKLFEEKTFAEGELDLNIRLMTGGSSASSNKDNEWDRIIVENSLNGKITAGDNSIWNWNGMYTLTSSTTSSNIYRNLRGNGSSTTWSEIGSNTAQLNLGFRPVFIVDVLNAPPTLNLNPVIANIYDIIQPLNISGTLTDDKPDPMSFIIKHINTDIELINESISGNFSHDFDVSAFQKGVKHTIEIIATDSGTLEAKKQIIFIVFDTFYIVYDKSATTKNIPIPETMYGFVISCQTTNSVFILYSIDNGTTWTYTVNETPIEGISTNQVKLMFLMASDAKLKAYGIGWY